MTLNNPYSETNSLLNCTNLPENPNGTINNEAIAEIL